MFESKKKLKIVGVMNGTSLDGVDYVLCTWDRRTKSLQSIEKQSRAFPAQIRKRILQVSTGKASLSDYALLHQDLGKMYYQQLKDIFRKRSWQADLVGLHGQTVFHQGGKASLQIGEPSYISKMLKVPVVFDFRQADLVVGGEGAPLAGLFHQYLKKKWSLKGAVVFQNLGGIANSTYLNGSTTISYDSGPANMLMDIHISRLTKGRLSLDKDGQLAKKGSCDYELLKEMKTHRYFPKKAPKSCGREEFGELFYESYQQKLDNLPSHDSMATLNMLTASTVVDSYEKLLPSFPKEVILCGGGALNRQLLSNMKSLVGNRAKLSLSSDYSWGELEIEAAAFAYFAALWVEKKASNTGPLTGAKNPVILGKLCI